MIKVCKVVELPMPWVDYFDRTKDLEYYHKYPYGRKDIVLVQFMDIANVFFHYDGSFQINLWNGVEVNEDGQDEIETRAVKEFLKVCREQPEFIEKHRKLFEEIL